MRPKESTASLAGAGDDPRRPAHAGGRLDGDTQTLLSSPAASAVANSLPEPCLRPGDVLLERFRVRRLLARGGMGEVYEADDAALGARVALKTMRTSVLAHPLALGQFRREVLLARRVTHPNVCRLFEFFSSQEDGAFPLVFLTMELLEGPTLADRLLRSGKFGNEALPVVRQLVAALSAAHREGIVHRDFKSSNVMLVHASDGSQRVVVTDFGLACGVGPGEARDLLSPSGMVGSPLYMAPEQVTGSPVSPATDVYSLGVVLYEMVTGTLPFVAGSLVEAAFQRLQRPPEPPSARRPDLSARWDATILRCLEVEPGRRFSHVEELLLALGDGPVLSLPTRRQRLRHSVAAAGMALALLTGDSSAAPSLAGFASGPATEAVRSA